MQRPPLAKVCPFDGSICYGTGDEFGPPCTLTVCQRQNVDHSQRLAPANLEDDKHETKDDANTDGR